ncbi:MULTISPECIES: type 1 glutamine amidotransferase [Aphanothece]|uniref:type 1 glutamine amidotransferase n=1 Tax=Aphanothece TaxID=1121 RepID=UPI0039851AFB
MPRLLVVQHLEREGPGLFAQAAAARGWELQVFRPDRGEPLPEPGPGDLLLVLGGPMGVAQIGDPALPWLAAEVALLERVLRQQRPVVGICLGAQLLAHAAGGAVEPLAIGTAATPVREVGWGAVSFSRTPEQEPLLVGLDPSELVLHWHGDRILLPEGATLLASSLLCREQMFRLGSRALGLQFHVELLPDDLERWLQEDGAYVEEALGPAGAVRLREEAGRWGDRARRQGRRLIDNLLDGMALS